VALAMHCNLRHSTLRQSFSALLTRPTLHQRINFKTVGQCAAELLMQIFPQKDISAIGEHSVSVFVAKVLYWHAQKLLFPIELPVKILTPPLDLASQILYMTQMCCDRWAFTSILGHIFTAHAQ